MMNDRFMKGADATRDVVEKVLNRLAMERFTKDGGDAIMSLSKKQAAFVDEMIESERWRKLLVNIRTTFFGFIFIFSKSLLANLKISDAHFMIAD